MRHVVLVCGGRDYADGARVYAVLDEEHMQRPITRIVHGAARGADSIAAGWAWKTGVSIAPYPADWGTHGKGAGPIRNARMLRNEEPDMVIAFPGGAGTADMVRRAVAAGVRVRLVDAALPESAQRGGGG